MSRSIYYVREFEKLRSPSPITEAMKETTIMRTASAYIITFFICRSSEKQDYNNRRIFQQKTCWITIYGIQYCSAEKIKSRLKIIIYGLMVRRKSDRHLGHCTTRTESQSYRTSTALCVQCTSEKKSSFTVHVQCLSLVLVYKFGAIPIDDAV